MPFDFEWTNQQLFYGMYRRTDSYFENSEMEAKGLPSPAELAILSPLRDLLWPEVFTKDYSPPSTAGPNGLRKNLLAALQMLRVAGWHVEDGILRNNETGEPFSFEILIVQPSFERVVLPFTANLKRLGIRAQVRLVDSSQYINRLREFDYDMIVAVFGQSLSPGNEQRWYWSSQAADIPGTRNYAGIKSEAVDRLVELVIAADSREALVNRCRALDRALLWGHYVIPHWYVGQFRVAYASRLRHPENPAALWTGTGFLVDGEVDDRIYHQTPFADHPNPFRDHDHQLFRHPGGTGWTGGNSCWPIWKARP